MYNQQTFIEMIVLMKLNEQEHVLSSSYFLLFIEHD